MSNNEVHKTEKIKETVNARPVTSNEVSYRNGYVDGRVSESYKLNQLKNRDNNNAFGGFLLGIFLTVAIGLVAGIYYSIFAQQQERTEPSAISEQQPTGAETTIIEKTKEVIPVPILSDKNAEQQRPDTETTIIERTKEVIPVPIQQAPEASSAEPKVEINIPSPAQQNTYDPQSSTNQTPTNKVASQSTESNFPVNSSTNETVTQPKN